MLKKKKTLLLFFMLTMAVVLAVSLTGFLVFGGKGREYRGTFVSAAQTVRSMNDGKR